MKIEKRWGKIWRNEKNVVISRVWEFVHIIIGHSITYECPIVL